MDPLTAFLFFGVPTTVGLIGLAAVKLHEWSDPFKVSDIKGTGKTVVDLTSGAVERDDAKNASPSMPLSFGGRPRFGSGRPIVDPYNVTIDFLPIETSKPAIHRPVDASEKVPEGKV